MPGTRDIGLGALIFLIGAGVTIATLGGNGGGVVAYGAILVGLAMIAKGVMENVQHKKAMANDGAGAEDGGEKGQTITQEQAHEMMDLIVGLAGADGQLDPGEQLILRSVARDVFGMEMSDQDVVEVYTRVTASPHGFEAGLYRLQGKIPASMTRLLLRYAAMVAYADGELAETERAALAKMAEILGLSEEAKAEEMASAFGTIQRIATEQQQAR